MSTAWGIVSKRHKESEAMRMCEDESKSEKIIGKRISASLNCGVRCNALRQNSLLLFQEVAVERRLCEQISCTALYVCVCDFECVDSFSWPPVETQISFSCRMFGSSLHELAQKGQVSLNSSSAELISVQALKCIWYNKKETLVLVSRTKSVYFWPERFDFTYNNSCTYIIWWIQSY